MEQRGGSGPASGLAPAAFIIGLTRGALVVLEDGQGVDTILYAPASVGAMAPACAGFTSSRRSISSPPGSLQAALTMPQMAPLAGLAHISRQTPVPAFQVGEEFTDVIIWGVGRPAALVGARIDRARRALLLYLAAFAFDWGALGVSCAVRCA